MTYFIIIKTPRFLRKPKTEMFTGEWKDETEVRRVLAKHRPKAKLVSARQLEWKN